MVSEMAIEDCEELLAQGLKLSCRDIVRLNALGVKAERGRDSVSFYALPRCCFLGKVCFREPTIGHEIWYDDVSREFDADDPVTDFLLRAYMMTRDADELPPPANVAEVEYQLEQFKRRTVAEFTTRQVVHAMAYCSAGCDADADELPDVPDRAAPEEAQSADQSIALGVVREGQALGLGISLADAKGMTRSALQDVVFRAYDMKDIHVGESVRKQCLGDYLATLNNVKARLEEGAKARLEEDGNG